MAPSAACRWRHSCSSCSARSRGSRRCRPRPGRCVGAPSPHSVWRSSPRSPRPSSDPAQPRLLDESQLAPLALESVRFRYGDRGGWLLDGVDLRIEPGRRVVLAGPSGAGKTTIALLFVRFIDPSVGRDARWRRSPRARPTRCVATSCSPPRTHTCSPPRSARTCCSPTARRPRTRSGTPWRRRGSADWVRALPEGLDTLLGEDGDLVSGGERQRIALARALLSDARTDPRWSRPPYLDADTATAMMRRISAAAGDRGVLVISHRSEGLEGFDLIDWRTDGCSAPSRRPRVARV